MRKCTFFEWDLMSSKQIMKLVLAPCSPTTLHFWDSSEDYLGSEACKIVGDFIHVMMPICIPQKLAQKWTFKTELL